MSVISVSGESTYSASESFGFNFSSMACHICILKDIVKISSSPRFTENSHFHIYSTNMYIVFQGKNPAVVTKDEASVYLCSASVLLKLIVLTLSISLT